VGKSPCAVDTAITFITPFGTVSKAILRESLMAKESR
jgi:hypothetical protein